MNKKFLTEVDRFARCMDGAKETQIGLKQFHEYESKGIYPDIPDPYFTRLLNGKKWWEWTLNFMAETYCTWEWYGWYGYAKDFINDPAGFKQLRQRCNQKPVDPE